jgi:acyl transferase domain-containing protein
MGYFGFLSPDGKSYCFDHRANGYARGEGVGSVVVMRLSDAIRDGNIIRAIVRGSGVNQDGRTPGISVPSADAQERLIRTVYETARLSPNDTLMVEAHGTGTVVGDPIEATAIARTFQSTKRRTPLVIGAVKSGIGHLEGAAGIAGIIKSVLVLESAIIPPNVNFEKANPKISADQLRLHFPQKNMPWPNNYLRRISVNSFGVGGTNGHTILDDAYHYLRDRGIKALHNTTSIVPSQKKIDDHQARIKQETSCSPKTRTDQISSHSDLNIHYIANNEENLKIPGSWDYTSEVSSKDNEANIVSIIVPMTAFDKGGIQRTARKHTQFLEEQLLCNPQQGEQLLLRYAYTMSRKRTIFQCRSYIVATSIHDLLTKLSRPLSVRVKRQWLPELAFVFTGQGVQWPSMGMAFMVYPAFKVSLESASEYMRSLDPSLCVLDEIRKNASHSRIHDSYIAQPACTAIQIALVDLLASWGIRPSQCCGHSSGEIAAAYCAGRISRQVAWTIAQLRGRVSSNVQQSQGSMLSVGLAATDLAHYMQLIDGKIEGPVSSNQRNVQLFWDSYRYYFR